MDGPGHLSPYDSLADNTGGKSVLGWGKRGEKYGCFVGADKRSNTICSDGHKGNGRSESI